MNTPAPRRAAKAARIGAPEPIAALNRVRIIEYALPYDSREPLVDIRTHCPRVEVREDVCPYLRRGVADKLNAAQNSLPPGYTLQVKSALRTLAAQQAGWDGYFAEMKAAHPDWPLSALRRATNKFFAPYDQKAPPGHCTGGAVDVGMRGPDGEPLDMTAPTKGWEGAYTWSDLISPEAKRNRMMMVEAMLGAGFSNCRDEYWHYSWGDSAWAVRVGETECPYGWAHAPVALEAGFVRGSGAGLAVNTLRGTDGRVMHAEAVCEIPQGSPLLCVGLYWAGGVPVTLRVRWRSGQSAPDFHVGANLLRGPRDPATEETWEPLPNVESEDDTYLLRLTPRVDRIWIASARPAPSSQE